MISFFKWFGCWYVKLSLSDHFENFRSLLTRWLTDFILTLHPLRVYNAGHCEGFLTRALLHNAHTHEFVVLVGTSNLFWIKSLVHSMTTDTSAYQELIRSKCIFTLNPLLHAVNESLFLILYTHRLRTCSVFHVDLRTFLVTIIICRNFTLQVPMLEEWMEFVVHILKILSITLKKVLLLILN